MFNLFKKEEEKKEEESSVKPLNYCSPPNVGWLEYKLKSKEMDYLWRCIENKNEENNHLLAGNISKSYKLMDKDDWFFLNVIIPLLKNYAAVYDNLGNKLPFINPHPYYMPSWWVNYQKQNEFNPSHTHSGIYSFVIWMKIPTTYENQKKLSFAANATSKVISNFEFQYLNIVGEMSTHTYEMSPKLEGYMILFPSELRHQVYPFYECDEDRISVSGNISINPTRK